MKRKTNLLTKATGYLASYEFAAAVAACIVLWGGLSVRFLKLGPLDTMGLWPVKIFLALLFLNRLAGFAFESTGKKHSAFLSAGILIVLSGVFYNYFFRFEGNAAVGEGEVLSDYETARKGPLGRPPKLPLELLYVEGDPFSLDKESKAQFQIDGLNESLTAGQKIRRSTALEVKVAEIQIAPMFRLFGPAKAEVFSSFVKLKLYPKGRLDYFTVRELPHRFYLSLTGNEEKPFKLKIMRGKLMLADWEIRDDPVEFEDYGISFHSPLKWAEVEVKYNPGLVVVLAGGFMTALGAMIMFILRPSRG